MMNEKKLVRVQYAVYDSKEAALADGWPDAEFGSWQREPSSPKLVRGWIALEYDEPDDDDTEGESNHRTLQQAIDDWFYNSPSWPFTIDVNKETNDFLRDGCRWTRDEVREAIAKFKESLGSVPSGAGRQRGDLIED